MPCLGKSSWASCVRLRLHGDCLLSMCACRLTRGAGARAQRRTSIVSATSDWGGQTSGHGRESRTRGKKTEFRRWGRIGDGFGRWICWGHQMPEAIDKIQGACVRACSAYGLQEARGTAASASAKRGGAEQPPTAAGRRLCAGAAGKRVQYRRCWGFFFSRGQERVPAASGARYSSALAVASPRRQGRSAAPLGTSARSRGTLPPPALRAP